VRPLRWKGRFRTGDASADRRNRKFVDCLNEFINAAGQREHCWEMEETINQFSFEADTALQEHAANRDLKHEFGRRLLASLPLGPFGGIACRKCGLCDMAQKQIAEHLEASAQCLFDRSDP
jgi:hypothetical protein